MTYPHQSKWRFLPIALIAFLSIALGGKLLLGGSGSPRFYNLDLENLFHLERSYKRNIDIPVGATMFGMDAPSQIQIGTYKGLGVNRNVEQLFVAVPVPTDWDQESDVLLCIVWCPNPGTQLTNAQTVIWGVEYRVTVDGEGLENGSTESESTTHTQVGISEDAEQITSFVVFDRDSAEQAFNDPDVDRGTVGFIITRDFNADTYGSEAVVTRIFVTYFSDTMPSI